MNNSEYTYRRAAAKKRSDRRRRNRQMTVKSLRMVIICSILIFAVSIGGIIVKASDDSNRTRTYKYYTTVSVEDNDTLWSLADRYNNVDVLNEDILKVNISKLAEEKNNGKPIKVVANLPYYITTPIIMGLFESHVPIDSITIMVQKEVADRMQEGPGSKEYGALSLAVQYYAKPEIVVNVPPSCFMPQPKVGSAVIRLTRHSEPPVTVKSEKLLFQVIRASFNQRRKTLANGLANYGAFGLPKEELQACIEELGVPVNIRGEALSLDQFAQLSNIIYDHRSAV